MSVKTFREPCPLPRHRTEDVSGRRYNDALRRSWKAVLYAVCVFGLLAAAPPGRSEADAKTDVLQTKIADITLLEQQLTERQQEIDTIRRELAQRKKGLVEEIVHLKKSLAIDSYAKAQQHPRIGHNLEILRLIAGFSYALDTKWAFYQSGCNRLDYLRQSAQDDLRMVATLNNLKIDALTTQISLVINGYLPEAHTMQIDPAAFKLPDAQTVWDNISTRETK